MSNNESNNQKNWGTCLATHLSNSLYQSIILDKAGEINLAQEQTRSYVIDSSLSYLAQNQKVGDWIQLPDGTTYTMTFQPRTPKA